MKSTMTEFREAIIIFVLVALFAFIVFDSLWEYKIYQKHKKIKDKDGIS
jgi:hypothetical protein